MGASILFLLNLLMILLFLVLLTLLCKLFVSLVLFIPPFNLLQIASQLLLLIIPSRIASCMLYLNGRAVAMGGTILTCSAGMGGAML